MTALDRTRGPWTVAPGANVHPYVVVGPDENHVAGTYTTKRTRAKAVLEFTPRPRTLPIGQQRRLENDDVIDASDQDGFCRRPFPRHDLNAPIRAGWYGQRRHED